MALNMSKWIKCPRASECSSRDPAVVTCIEVLEKCAAIGSVELWVERVSARFPSYVHRKKHAVALIHQGSSVWDFGFEDFSWLRDPDKPDANVSDIPRGVFWLFEHTDHTPWEILFHFIMLAITTQLPPVEAQLAEPHRAAEILRGIREVANLNYIAAIEDHYWTLQKGKGLGKGKGCKFTSWDIDFLPRLNTMSPLDYLSTRRKIVLGLKDSEDKP